MLSNSIALIAVAALFGVEAFKARDRIPRLVLTALAVLFAAGGAFLKPLTDQVPRLGTLIAETFSQPAAWFVLLMGLFFVVRPLWSKGPSARDTDTHEKLKQFGVRGVNLARYITKYRATKTFFRDDLPPIDDVVMQGASLLLSLQKAGVAVPKLDHTDGYRRAVVMEHFFTVIGPLIKDGHVDVLLSEGEVIAENADRRGADFSHSDWWTHGW